ncbi:hypothetical protein HZQ44_13030 [Elizabethkingia anophelis]|uniref:hypothetical protein n=1 Tax=Elizabethkingia anophelis TaxID=1117645 RepID=UPI0021A65ABE|nr:hypothetical protein [Elizabethkingia anophelis]MCT3694845.1 hypothetical protein [Elizabethkingia anophelis]MCT3860070.1 hypothetical protein [Elizabethkingia anophelis]MCT3913375.1 hypothetical protein [Elizabethkingia anophelis]MCT4216618.1 hypothetical protein [Elizabethkingia anophelis]
MIQFLLMLLGLAFPNNNAPASVNHPTTISTYSMDSGDPGDTVGDIGGDTSGNEGQTPPPKK